MNNTKLSVTNLSFKDIAFLILHPDCFSFFNKNYIFFNKENWMETPDIRKYIDDENSELQKAIKTMEFTKGVIKDIARNNGGERIVTSVIAWLSSLESQPTDTVDSMKQFILGLSMDSFLIKLNSLDAELEDTSARISDMILTYIIEILLPIKIKAFCILRKSALSIRPNDEREYDIIVNYELYLLQQFTNMHNHNDVLSNILLYLLMRSIGFTDDELGGNDHNTDNLTAFIRYKKVTNKSIFIDDTLRNLISGKDILSVMKTLKSDYANILPEDLLDIMNRRMTDIYDSEKKIVSTSTDDDICIGDEMLINGNEMTLNDVRSIIYQLSEDNIQDYIGPKVITFTMNEDELGAIKAEGYPVLKYLSKGDGFKTITQFNGDIYLLFHIVGIDALFAISAKSDPSTNARKLCKVVFPSDKHWELVTK